MGLPRYLQTLFIFFILVLMLVPGSCLAWDYDWSIEDAQSSTDDDEINFVAPIKLAYEGGVKYIVNIRYVSDVIYVKAGKVHGPDDYPIGHNVTWGTEIALCKAVWFGAVKPYTFIEVSPWSLDNFAVTFNDDWQKVIRVFFMDFKSSGLTISEISNKTVSYREPDQFRYCRAHTVSLVNGTGGYNTLLIANHRYGEYNYLNLIRIDAGRTWTSFLIVDLPMGGEFSCSLLALTEELAYLSYSGYHRLVTLSNSNAQGFDEHTATLFNQYPYFNEVWEHTPLRACGSSLYMWAIVENVGVDYRHAVRYMVVNETSMTLDCLPWVNGTTLTSPYHAPYQPLRESFVMGFNNPELLPGGWFNDLGIYYYYVHHEEQWMAMQFSYLGASPYVGVYTPVELSSITNAPTGEYSEYVNGLGGNYGIDLQLSAYFNMCLAQDSDSKATVRFVSVIGWDDEYSVDFEGVPTSGYEPLEVQFTYTGSWFPDVSYYWEFGDGGNSTERDPVYTYEDPGVYDVNLTVTSEDIGTYYENKSAYITVITEGSTIYIDYSSWSMFWMLGFVVAFVLIVTMLKRGK